MFICNRIKKARAEGTKCHAKTMMSKRSQFVVYYGSLKRELKTKPIKECRYDERLQTRVEDLEVASLHKNTGKEKEKNFLHSSVRL